MSFQRGDVVLVDFPFATGTSQKLRPAVVVQNDPYNHRLASTIFVPITSNTGHLAEPSQVALDPATPDGRKTGLLRLSAIKCENIATVETRLIRRKIGILSPSLLKQLDAALKVTLGLT